MRHPLLSWFLLLGLAGTLLAGRPLISAHRGMGPSSPTNPWPENTLPSLTRAFEEGADLVEVDIQLDAAGELVVSHEHHLEVDGRKVRLSGLPRKEYPEQVGSEGLRTEIPRFEDALLLALEMGPGRKVMDVELKVRVKARREHQCRELARLLEEHGAVDRVYVKSFDLAAVRRMEELLPGVESGIPAFEPAEGLDKLARLHREGFPRIEWIQPRAFWEPGKPRAEEIVARAHAMGVKVAVWTLNRPWEIRRWARAGADVILTDVPGMARSTLGP